jgi:hypothetical protein
MNEYLTMWQSFIALILASVAALLYSWGGRKGKWKRRFIGSFVLAFAVNGLLVWRGIWNPWVLGVWPLLAIGFSMRYGANETSLKVIRRSLYALMVMSAGLLLAVVYGGNAWVLFVPHVGIGLWSVWLGVKNPIDAASEETLICAALNLCLVFYPFITGV